VPTEILDVGALERIPPGPCVDLPHRPALEREYAQRMLPELLAEHGHSLAHQRHADRIAAYRNIVARFGLTWASDVFVRAIHVACLSADGAHPAASTETRSSKLQDFARPV
jgi:hypothetical protein